MNKWTEISIKNTYVEPYLDNLLEIYPIKDNPRRSMPDNLKDNIEKAYDDKDFVSLIKVLNVGVVKYKLKFPIDCSYIPSFRKEPKWLENNPLTVECIGNLLVRLSKEKLFKRCIKPKKSSRQVGPEFYQWFEAKFGTDEEIEILGTSDTDRKIKAMQLIDYNGEKGFDLFIRINDILVIGEAKFITDEGGEQWDRLTAAFKIFNSYEKHENVLPIAIIDGICYRDSNTKFNKKIINSDDNKIIISALLLEELFEEIKKITVPEEGLPNEKIIELI